MKKIKWFYPVILFVLLLPQEAIARQGTPYHSIDEHNFESVIEGLRSNNPDKTVVRVATWSQYNFRYVSDMSQYGVLDYWGTAQETFYSGAEDCDGKGFRDAYMLRKLGIEATCWYIWDRETFAHVVTIAPYRGGWTYLDTGKFYTGRRYDTHEEAVNAFFGKAKTNVSGPLEEIMEKPNKSSDPPSLPVKFTNSFRLQMHAHLTECEGNKVELMIPANREEKAYSRLANKDAIGFLIKTNFLGMEATGLSYGEFGWYSPSREFNDRMYTLHFLFPYVGINAYTGDYQGVDIDVNPISTKFLKAYVCMRNFGEVWDYKAVVTPFKFFEGVAEYNDKNLIYGAYLKIYDSLSYCKLGYGTDKEWKIEMKGGGRGVNFSAGEYYKLSFTVDW